MEANKLNPYKIFIYILCYMAIFLCVTDIRKSQKAERHFQTTIILECSERGVCRKLSEETVEVKR